MILVVPPNSLLSPYIPPPLSRHSELDTPLCRHKSCGTVKKISTFQKIHFFLNRIKMIFRPIYINVWFKSTVSHSPPGEPPGFTARHPRTPGNSYHINPAPPGFHTFFEKKVKFPGGGVVHGRFEPHIRTTWDDDLKLWLGCYDDKRKRSTSTLMWSRE